MLYAQRHTCRLLAVCLAAALMAGCPSGVPSRTVEIPATLAHYYGDLGPITLCCKELPEGPVAEIGIRPQDPQGHRVDWDSAALSLDDVEGPLQFKLDSGALSPNRRVRIYNGSPFSVWVHLTSCDFEQAAFTLVLAAERYPDTSTARSPTAVVVDRRRIEITNTCYEKPPSPPPPPPMNVKSDVNGDGVPDLVVSAPLSHLRKGQVYVFFGPLGPGSRDATDADVILTGDAADDNFGVAVAAGDINADGTADILVGAPWHDAAGSDSGRAYVFLGGPNLANRLASDADLILTGESAGQHFGSSLAIGHVGSDLRADLLIGSFPHNGKGNVFVFFGPRHDGSLAAGDADAILIGEQDASGFGGAVAVANVGDTATGDIVVGASRYHPTPGGPYTGRAYVFYGPLAAGRRWSAFSASAKLRGEAEYDQFGTSVGTGDLNGDSIADIIVGSQQNDAGGDDAGRAYVFFGGGSLGYRAAADADAVFTGEAAGDGFGADLAAGDIDGDGTDDLLVGAPGTGEGAGRVHLFFGSAGLPDRNASDSDASVRGEAAGDRLGICVSVADVTDDAFAELLVGAPPNTVQKKGRSYVCFGGDRAAIGHRDAADADAVLTGREPRDEFGSSIPK